MKIVVCLKHILDPEMAPKDFKIDQDTRRTVPGNAKLVLDSYAENALEVALQLREKHGGQISTICVGDKQAESALRRALSLKVDTAVRIWDPAWGELDALAVAHVIGKTVEKLGGADLVLCGRQSGDIERGLVGPMLAEELGAACTTICYQAEASGHGLILKCEADGGYVSVESRLPAVVTISSNKTNVPRLAKVKDLMMASQKPITVFSAEDLNLDSNCMSQSTLLRELFIPEQDGSCELVEGDDGPGKAENLIRRLVELKIV